MIVQRSMKSLKLLDIASGFLNGGRPFLAIKKRACCVASKDQYIEPDRGIIEVTLSMVSSM